MAIGDHLARVDKYRMQFHWHSIFRNIINTLLSTEYLFGNITMIGIAVSPVALSNFCADFVGDIIFVTDPASILCHTSLC